MCVNYHSVPKEAIEEVFGVTASATMEWPAEVWQDYAAPIITGDGSSRALAVASYGMVPKRFIPAGVKKFTTMNARYEDIGTKRSYSKQWREGQVCLVPMLGFYEPNWESGKHVRWRIGMADSAPFAVAGIWRTWAEPDGGTSLSFTQLTMNADEHPVMSKFHKPGQEKRSLIVVPRAEWDDWLGCRDPEVARSFARLLPAALLDAYAAPKTLPIVELVADETGTTSLFH